MWVATALQVPAELKGGTERRDRALARGKIAKIRVKAQPRGEEATSRKKFN